MPLYEYRCEKCGYEMEALQKIGDSPLVNCPQCAQSALKKLISAAGFRLKGSGWYETDFKGGTKKNLHDSGEKKGSGAEKDTKKDKGSGEGKPAATPKASAAS